jgi:hypothetical protein
MMNFGIEGVGVLEGFERMWKFQIWFLKIVNSLQEFVMIKLIYFQLIKL